MKALAAKEAELNAGKEPKMSAGISLPGLCKPGACMWRHCGGAGGIGEGESARVIARKRHPLPTSAPSTHTPLPARPRHPRFSQPTRVALPTNTCDCGESGQWVAGG